ncbi:S26 family signal peptidase [Williamwhitmania taraxaci]|uniref:Signal peptidase I n=1 Tax=Williamwhitmania taraxaci TaxID=1640674 RepID=A0A1G6P7N8_9BACT|nr:S26 family signal peptidase [Williamwhitmania taraxaci]SDC75961.1 signal peptidase I [Williamwhitmania taraxaci]
MVQSKKRPAPRKKPIAKKRPATTGKKSKGAIKEWIIALLIALVLITFIRVLLVDIVMVRDEQMQATFSSGKVIAISKISPGARFPITLFSWESPKDSVGNFTGYDFTLQLPPIRFWSNKIKSTDKGKIYAYNEPDDNPKIPIDKKKFVLGRAVAIPGDIVLLEQGQIIVNGVAVSYPLSAEYFYHLKAKGSSKAMLAKIEIEEASTGKDGIVQLYATKEQAKKIKAFESVKSIVHETVSSHHDFMHLLSKFKKGFRLPTKGDSISLEAGNFEIYAPLIIGGESIDAELRLDGLYIDGKIVSAYTFKNSYYFMLKDNVDNSIDSRSYGPVSESYLIGRVTGQ